MPWQLDLLNVSVTEILESVEKRGRAYSWYGDEFAAMAKIEKPKEGDTNQNALILHRNTPRTIVDLYFLPNGEFELSVGFRAKANGRQRLYQYTSGHIKTENMTCEEYRFIAQNLQEFSLLLGEPSSKR